MNQACEEENKRWEKPWVMKKGLPNDISSFIFFSVVITHRLTLGFSSSCTFHFVANMKVGSEKS